MVVALALSGCHLIFRYEDRAEVPDAAAPTDGPAPDVWPAGDWPSWPDLHISEQGRSDTGGFYVKEQFTGGKGVVQDKTCAWQVFDGLMHQTTTAQNGCHATASVPARDYTAETRVQIHAIKGMPDWSEGAGLGVRVQAAGYKPPAPPAMYVCAISPDANQLVLARCPGGGINDCTIMDSRIMTISTGKPYRIRMAALGVLLNCSLPDLGKSILYPILDMPDGGVALVTFYSRSSFDYLAVWP